MEKKNKCVRSGFSIILWAVMAIVLCAAPAGWAVTFDDKGKHDIDYAIYLDSVEVGNATVNLLPGAYIDWFVYTTNNSIVNIKGGEVGWWIDVAPGAEVTIYGTGFNLGEGVKEINGTVTGYYENGDPINLTFDCHPGATVTLAAPGGGDSITVNIEKAKVSWDHSDIHVYGKLYLPQGFWMDTLGPNGGVVTTLAGVEVANQDVEFELKGKKGDKWEYKDKENSVCNIKEFKIDWKGAKFDYKDDDKFHIHTHFIGGTETTLCIHSDDTLWPFTVTIDETTIEYDGNGDITGDIEGDDIDPQKDDNTHVHFTLPFQLSPDMTIEVTEAIELTIDVADYYEEGFVKFKLISVFNPDSSWDSSDELKCVILLGLGDDMISGNDLIGAWTKKDDKHWDYK